MEYKWTNAICLRNLSKPYRSCSKMVHLDLQSGDWPDRTSTSEFGLPATTLFGSSWSSILIFFASNYSAAKSQLMCTFTD